MDPGSVGRGREKGAREDREAFGGGGEPRGLGSQLVATKLAPSAGCPGQCKLTRGPGPIFLLAGELTVQQGSHHKSENYVESSLNSLEEKVLQKFQGILIHFTRPLGCCANPRAWGSDVLR